MAVPALPFSLSDVIAEFGGGSSLTDFYRGGAFVPDIPANSNVPTSGAISLSQLAGATNTQINLSGESVTHNDFPLAIAAIRINADGTVDRIAGAVATQVDVATDWILPNNAANGSYEVRCTLNSGTAPTDSALNTWLSLGADRTWQLTKSNPGTDTCNLTIEIRQSSTVLASATYNLTATRT